MQYFVLTALLLGTLVSGSEWTYSSDRGAKAGVLIGVGAGSDTLAVCAMGDNGIGAEVSVYNEGTWKKVPANAGMLLDAAVMETGTVIASSLGNIFMSNDTGASYFPLDISYIGTSQSANVIKADSTFALVGQFVDKSSGKQTNGVLRLSNKGEFISASDIGLDSVNMARYGSFPSADTWYVSSGFWGDHPDDSTHLLSRHLGIEKDNNDGGRVINRPYGPLKKVNAQDEDTGWYMSVSKTTDGGATFQTVYTSPAGSYYYANGISCSDESHCVVVAEGYLSDGTPSVWAFVTFDGGDTWTNTLTKGEGESGLMSASFLSATEGWLGGFGVGDQRQYEGHFWYTSDGGKSWEIEGTLDNCLVLDMDFSATVGYAACVPPSGGAGNVAMYQ